MLAKLLAVAIREVREELRRLDEPPAPQAPEPQPGPPQPDESRHRYDPASTTGASTERAASWDHDKTPPVRAFGFGRPA